MPAALCGTDATTMLDPMSRPTDLTVDECLALARTRSVGRIALQTEDGLRIFPVNYTVVGDALVFRTLPYGAIATSAHNAEVAFEIDQLDEKAHTGWSVVAAGRCSRVEDPEEMRELRDLHDPGPWAEGQRTLYFMVRWSVLTGRRLGEPDSQSLTL